MILIVHVKLRDFLLLYLSDALAENNRLKLTNSVVKAFSKLMSATRGEVICTVTTAKVSYMLAEKRVFN